MFQVFAVVLMAVLLKTIPVAAFEHEAFINRQFKSITSNKTADYCGIDMNDFVHCWSQYDAFEPPANLGRVKAVAVGEYACAITMNDRLRCWGSPNTTDGRVFIPSQLAYARAISTDYWGRACGISLEGKAYCWAAYDLEPEQPPGEDHLYEYEIRQLPPHYDNYENISVIQGGACLTASDGRADCWVESIDSLLLLPPNRAVSKISTDDWTTGCALSFDGQIRCFGTDYDAITGEPSKTVEKVPTNLGAARDLSVGRLSACAIAESGQIQCWLFSNDPDGEQLKNTPKEKAIAVATGAFNACAIRENRSVFCWGAE